MKSILQHLNTPAFGHPLLQRGSNDSEEGSSQMVVMDGLILFEMIPDEDRAP